MFKVATVLEPGVRGLGAKVTEVPAGTPAVAVSVIGVVKVPDTVVGIETVGSVGAGQALVDAVVGPKAKSFYQFCRIMCNKSTLWKQTISFNSF